MISGVVHTAARIGRNIFVAGVVVGTAGTLGLEHPDWFSGAHNSDVTGCNAGDLLVTHDDQNRPVVVLRQNARQGKPVRTAAEAGRAADDLTRGPTVALPAPMSSDCGALASLSPAETAALAGAGTGCKAGDLFVAGPNPHVVERVSAREGIVPADSNEANRVLNWGDQGVSTVALNPPAADCKA